MHYKNGREAKAGDRVFHPGYGLSGVLHSVNAQSTTCNGRIAPVGQNDPYINIKDCLHVDDISAATIPDATVPSSTIATPAPGSEQQTSSTEHSTTA